MEAQQLWQAVLGDLEVRLSKTAFNNWLRPTRVVAFHDDTVTVAAANTFGAATLQGRYASQIERAVSDLVGRPIKVEFTITERGESTRQPEGGRVLAAPTPSPAPRTVGSGDQSRPESRPTKAPPTPAHPTQRPSPSRPAAPLSQQLELSAAPNHGLNPRYVYESYVVGSSNRFAHAASLSVAEHPGGKLQPLLRLRRRRSGQDPPAPRHRPPRPGAAPGPADHLRLLGKIHQRPDQRDPRAANGRVPRPLSRASTS